MMKYSENTQPLILKDLKPKNDIYQWLSIAEPA